jgi:rubredoxin
MNFHLSQKTPKPEHAAGWTPERIEFLKELWECPVCRHPSVPAFRAALAAYDNLIAEVEGAYVE